MTKCPICNESDWDQGTVEIGYFPQRWWCGKNILYHTHTKKVKDKKIHLLGNVCINCGHVKLYIESKYLPKKKNRKKGRFWM